jgi:hypothetical protein
VLVVISAVGQSRTYGGDTVDRIADLVTDPAAHQTCIEGPSARVCSYPELMEIAEGWLAVASKVSDAAPTAAIDRPVEVHVRLSPEEIALLAAPVRAELERRADSFPWAGEPGLHPDLRWGGADDVDTRALLVAHELVGLPEPAAPPVVACFAGGQARSAISIALAGRALPDGRHNDYRSPSEGGNPSDSGARLDDPTVTDLAEESWETDTEPAVVHSASDLAIGRALLDRPEDEVRAVLADGWETWIDPATPTADLATAFGLAADPPAEIPEGLAACA